MLGVFLAFVFTNQKWTQVKRDQMTINVIYAFGTADMPAAVRSALDEQVAGYLTKDKPLETLVSALASKSAAVQGAQRLQ